MTHFRSGAINGVLLCTSIFGLGSCAAPAQHTAQRTDRAQRTYEKAIKDASVRGSDWDTPLWPLAAGTVSVSTFTEDAELDVRSSYVWVAATQEIRQACSGRRDPVLRLQQILGLPPQKDPKPGHRWHFFVFDVDSRDLFRPCPGGVDLHAPDKPKCLLDSSLDPQLDPELTEFLLQQWWLSHRATIEYGRDPELGYPWTGMGWTYDWDPASKSHRGVSEFVVRKTAAIDRLRTVSPQSFCAAAAGPPSAAQSTGN